MLFKADVVRLRVTYLWALTDFFEPSKICNHSLLALQGRRNNNNNFRKLGELTCLLLFLFQMLHIWHWQEPVQVLRRILHYNSCESQSRQTKYSNKYKKVSTENQTKKHGQCDEIFGPLADEPNDKLKEFQVTLASFESLRQLDILPVSEPKKKLSMTVKKTTKTVSLLGTIKASLISLNDTLYKTLTRGPWATLLTWANCHKYIHVVGMKYNW